MRKTVLYIAMSLDGYIARDDYSVDWLEEGSLAKFNDFYKSVDTVILGATTYKQIISSLSDEWPYKGKKTYVLTNEKNKDRNIITSSNINELFLQLKNSEGKNIWICGGANVINQAFDYIDEFIISIIPILLGKGIKLFHEKNDIKLKLVKSEEYDGIVDLTYVRR